VQAYVAGLYAARAAGDDEDVAATLILIGEAFEERSASQDALGSYETHWAERLGLKNAHFTSQDALGSYETHWGTTRRSCGCWPRDLPAQTRRWQRRSQPCRKAPRPLRAAAGHP